MRASRPNFLTHQCENTKTDDKCFTSNCSFDIEKGQDRSLSHAHPNQRKHKLSSFDFKFECYYIKVDLQKVSTKHLMLGLSGFISFLSLYLCLKTSTKCSNRISKEYIPGCTGYYDHIEFILFFSLFFGLIVSSPVLLSPQFCIRESYYFGLLIDKNLISQNLLIQILEIIGYTNPLQAKTIGYRIELLTKYILNVVLASLNILAFTKLLIAIV